MEKIVYKIVSFFIFFGIILTVLEECKNSIADKFLDSLFSPTKSVKDKDIISDDDICKAGAVELNVAVNTRILQINSQITNLSTTNVNIQQEINPINILINSYNQSISEQYTYINKTNIHQETLIRWIEENNSRISHLERKYNELESYINKLKLEIANLQSQINSLKNAVKKNAYKESDIVSKNEYDNLKNDLLKRIEELTEKVNSQTKELKNNTRLLAELEKSLDKCVEQLKEINKKLDKLIEQSGKSDGGASEDRTYYWIIGTEDELKSKGIITSGGLFGGLKVNSDLNKDLFIFLDGNTKSILLGSESVEFEILSDMPADSYDCRIINQAKVLVIKDIDRFWGKTEFLVIKQTNNN